MSQDVQGKSEKEGAATLQQKQNHPNVPIRIRSADKIQLLIQMV